MTITHSLTASTRRPLVSAEFNIASAQRGLTPLDGKVVYIGTQSAAATKTAETLHEVFSEAEAELFWGKDSPVALMVRWGMKGARDYGKAPRFFAVGVTEPGAGVANAQTLTVSGTATEGKNVIVEIAGRRAVAGVASGDAAATVAAALEAAIDELAGDLPVTAGVAAAVVTCTHVTKGENGGDVSIKVIDTPAGISIAVATSAAGSGVIDITNALDVLVGEDFDFVVAENHKAADVTDFATHLAAMWTPGTNRFRWSAMGETGSLATGQALATAADDFKQVVFTAENFPNTPSEIAAYWCAIFAGEDDPALHFNDLEAPSLFLPADADIPTIAEIESAIAGGMTILTVNDAKTRVKLVRAVTTKVTHASVPFYALLDITISRTMVWAARQVMIKQKLAMSIPANKKITAATRARMRSVAYNVLKAGEELERLQNVDAHAAELVVETDPLEATRMVTAIPTSVVPPFNQLVDVFNLIVE